MEEPRQPRPSWAMPGGNKPSEAKRISTAEEKKPLDAISENDQLKNYKKNWDTSTLPKGGVAARLQAFKALAEKNTEPGLNNTGITNKNVVHQDSVSSAPVVKSPKPVKGELSAWQKKRTVRTRAATKLQALVRAKQARKRVIKKIHRHYEEQMRAEKGDRFDIEVAAAIKIQALVRSAFTRVRVCRMVEDLIAGLLAGEAENDEEAFFLELRAANATKAEEEEKLKSERETQRKTEKEKKAAAEAEKVRRRKIAQKLPECFIGPLQRSVGLLPQWWLEYTPHFIKDMETFSGQEEEYWQRVSK